MAPSLSRRAVLRGLGASVASLAFPLRLDAVTASDPPAVCQGYRPHVAAGWVPAGEPGAFERALRGVVDAATDFAWLAPGDRVLVKVASNSGSRYPATSSPAALFALARLLYARGAGTVWVGDQAGVHLVHHTRNERKGSTRALMRQNGLWQAATAAGAATGATRCGSRARRPRRTTSSTCRASAITPSPSRRSVSSSASAGCAKTAASSYTATPTPSPRSSRR